MRRPTSRGDSSRKGQLAELDKAILDLESQKVDESMQEAKIEIRQREKNRTNEIFPTTRKIWKSIYSWGQEVQEQMTDVDEEETSDRDVGDPMFYVCNSLYESAQF
ncbi:uncharacterized protein BO96DRAFT_482220 [Aspergillus niger CBS 101883]|uniref:uncharacterized protein n=1 Tax=Aspergillus lacticoffeatus (strain CBS 101883) TaxID=1450533 RepID=UPI000D7F87C3|nr:uncharacterized protein BO96DRAFT_482220 [Aspergillus niger CBS 101883]PYH53185.1 hypothetical protein BO96DRAFT_482220 [Aspergillus niger CBS 101883]